MEITSRSRSAMLFATETGRVGESLALQVAEIRKV